MKAKVAKPGGRSTIAWHESFQSLKREGKTWGGERWSGEERQKRQTVLFYHKALRCYGRIVVRRAQSYPSSQA